MCLHELILVKLSAQLGANNNMIIISAVMEAGGSNSLSNSSKMTSKVIGPNGKLLVEMWPTGDFVGPNASKFKTAIGDAVRLHIPINIPDFRKVQDCFKDAIWTALTVLTIFSSYAIISCNCSSTVMIYYVMLCYN